MQAGRFKMPLLDKLKYLYKNRTDLLLLYAEHLNNMVIQQ